MAIFRHGKDRDDEDAPKRYIKKKKWGFQPKKVAPDSRIWMEHAAVLKKAGVDVYGFANRRGR